MILNTDNITKEKIVNFLTTTELFAGISTEVLNEIVQELQITYLAGGDVLFNETEVGDALYVVMYGFLHALKQQDDGNQKIIAELGAGSIVGEIACLINTPRTATIYAVRDSILLKMNREMFDNFLKKYPIAMMGITRQSIQRLVAPNKHSKKSRITCFTLIPSSDFSDINHFSAIFVEKLSQYGDTLLLSQTIFDEINGSGASQTPPESSKNAEIMNWIQDLESKYRFIVYVADKFSPWSSRCLRQADKILLVGQLSDSPHLNEIEKNLFTNKNIKRCNVELALLSDTSMLFATGVKNWLQQRDIVRHYNLRVDKETDMARFIRLITGNGIGLVLGGGGAPAFSHLGVIRALEELHIPIDYVAGTSMGALISSGLGLDKNFESIMEILEDVIKRFTKKFDYTLPMSSLLKARLLGALLRESYGEETMIEELWQNFFCVSTDLSCNELCIHQDGLLWKAVRSSISLPAIFPALTDKDNHLHVDGAILNNLPVDIMKEKINGGRIIASSLAISNKISPLAYEDDTVSGWHLFLKYVVLPKIWPSRQQQKKQFLTIAAVIQDSMTLSSHRHQQAMVNLADYNVLLDSGNFGLMDFKQMSKLTELGYQKAMQYFEQTDLISIKNDQI